MIPRNDPPILFSDGLVLASNLLVAVTFAGRVDLPVTAQFIIVAVALAVMHAKVAMVITRKQRIDMLNDSLNVEEAMVVGRVSYLTHFARVALMLDPYTLYDFDLEDPKGADEMNIADAIQMDRQEAYKHYLRYKSHKVHQTRLDADIERLYKHIAAGKLIINALKAITDAGLGEDGLPKLCIAPADAFACHLSIEMNGSAVMSASENPRWSSNAVSNRTFRFPAGSFTGVKRWDRRQAITPPIPPEDRPKRGLPGYTILWEAVWKHLPPVDPMLLKRIGKTDFWIVLAAWELTDVERAVLGSHMSLGRRN